MKTGVRAAVAVGSQQGSMVSSTEGLPVNGAAPGVVLIETLRATGASVAEAIRLLNQEYPPLVNAPSLASWAKDELLRILGEAEMGSKDQSSRFSVALKAIFEADPSVGQSALDSMESVVLSGHCDLSGIAGLKALPKGLDAQGDLVLANCKKLQRLPAGMSMRGELILAGCKGLRSIPDGLEVFGNLDLRGCRKLGRWPEGLIVHGDLDLCGSGLDGESAEAVLGSVHIEGNLYHARDPRPFDSLSMDEQMDWVDLIRKEHPPSKVGSKQAFQIAEAEYLSRGGWLG